MLEIKYVSPGLVRKEPRNPKDHDIQRIIASIREFGFVTPIIIDKRTNKLIAGHGRLEAIETMIIEGQPKPAGIIDDETGWLIPAVTGWESKDDTAAMAYLIADNQHTIIGGWDEAALSELLAEIDDTYADILDMTPPEIDDIAPEIDDIEQPTKTGNTITITSVPPELMVRWLSHLDTHMGDSIQALTALLGDF